MLENRLPAALRNRGAALALSIVVMLAAFFGLGGAKLKAKYNSASQWFPYGVAADNGYTLNEELLTRLNTAANVITTGTSTLGADSTEVQAAQTALDDFSACLDAVQADGSKQDLTSRPTIRAARCTPSIRPTRHLALPSTSSMQNSRSRPRTP